jgi:aminoglycoside phosphotransferase (APT) family kinase protein
MAPAEEIFEAIRSAFGDRAAAARLEPMAAGKSGAQLFSFAIDGVDYVARKTGSSDPSDPTKLERELACIRIAAQLGVAPRLVHGDPARGITIMEKVAGTPIGRGTPRDGDPLGRTARILRTLHLGPRFPASPGFAVMFSGVEAALRAKGAPPLPAELVDTVMTVAGAVEQGAEPVSCHRDLNPTNILATPERIYLVDWEVAGLSDPFLDLGQLGIWVCRDAAERAHLLASYLEHTPTSGEIARALRCRVLALGFYAAAFYVVSMLTGRTVTPTADDNALDAVFSRMARTGQPFTPDEMAAALVAETSREARAVSL